MISVYLISGKIKSGKDTIADYMLQKLGQTAKKVCFADEVRSMINKLFGIPIELMKSQEGKLSKSHIKIKDLVRTEDLHRFDLSQEYLTIRELLQYFASDIFRKADYACWARVFWKLNHQGFNKFVVPDWRFPIEYELGLPFVKKLGYKIYTIRLTRNSKVINFTKFAPLSNDGVSNHESETSLDNFENFDYILYNNNEPVETTLRRVDKILRDTNKSWY